MSREEEIATIAKSAELGLPLNFPWVPSSQAVFPGATFHSRLSNTLQPWSKDSPFDPISLSRLPLLFNNDGGSANFQSAESELNKSSSEHLSVQFGISVGCPILKASVTGGYDKDTLNNHDERKNSIRSSFRFGSLVMSERPRLSDEARRILKHQGGLPAFKHRYGDYYVAGYRLGADAGVLLSETKTENSCTERLFVEVKVRVLFVEVGGTHEKFFHEASWGSTLRISGFSTLDSFLISETCPAIAINGSGLNEYMQKANGLVKTCIDLPEKVVKLVEAIGLKHNEIVAESVLEDLLKTGLIVELILLPLCKIREVIEWSMSTDIIGNK